MIHFVWRAEQGMASTGLARASKVTWWDQREVGGKGLDYCNTDDTRKRHELYLA